MAVIKTLIGNIKGPKGDTGEQGPTGAAGNDGLAANIEIGTTTTASPGTPARVENVGTPTNAILNFTIPQGQTGSINEIARVPVNEITTASGTFPTPIAGDTVATITGKQAKATQDAQEGIAQILGDLATFENGTTASKAYAIGDYLVLNGTFYRVTAAIAQGNQITVGGNVVSTNVGAEIASLNADLAMTLTPASSQVTIIRQSCRNLGKLYIVSIVFKISNGGITGVTPMINLPFTAEQPMDFIAQGQINKQACFGVIRGNRISGNGAFPDDNYFATFVCS